MSFRVRFIIGLVIVAILNVAGVRFARSENLPPIQVNVGEQGEGATS